MKFTIDQTLERRNKQIEYNRLNKIKPKALNKSLDNALTKNSVSTSYYEKEQRKNNENEISNLNIQIEQKIRNKKNLWNQQLRT